MQDTHIKKSLIAVAVMAVVALGAYSYSTLKSMRYANPHGPTTISVSGEGEVFAKPDVAQFSFTLEAKEANAADAQKKVSDALASITEYLKGVGVEEKDISTHGYNLNPWYEYPQDRICMGMGYCPPTSGEPILKGYQVNHTVYVKVRDAAKAGEILAEVGNKGAMNISGLSFVVDDTDALYAEARAKAIADAQAKADVLADNLGVRLGKIVGFWEENPGTYPYAYGGDMMMKSEMSMAPVTLPQGEEKVSVTVQVSYEFKSRGY